MTEPCTELEKIGRLEASSSFNKWILGGIFAVCGIALMPLFSMSTDVGVYKQQISQIMISSEKMAKDIDELKNMSKDIILLTSRQSALIERVKRLEEIKE